MVEVGDLVLYIDEYKKGFPALVTEVHGDCEQRPALSIVIVSGNEAEKDPYGRQIKRVTSVVHLQNNSAGAFCWREWVLSDA